MRGTPMNCSYMFSRRCGYGGTTTCHKRAIQSEHIPLHSCPGAYAAGVDCYK